MVLDHPHDKSSRILQEGQDATFLIKHIEYDINTGMFGQSARSGTNEDRRSHQTKNLQLPDGTIYEVKNAPEGWDDNLRSGKFNVEIPPGAIISSDGTIDVKGKKIITAALNGKEKSLFDVPNQVRSLITSRSPGGRELQTSVGTRSVLAVRVILSDAAYNRVDQTGLSNDIFGNGVDLYNLKSMYEACSFNQLTITKSPNRSMMSNPNDGTTDINNGVVDIVVSLSKSVGDSTIRNAVTTKINSVFGVTRPDQLANFVMYCMPPGVIGGIAYAYPNSWNSVYSNEWCNFPSTQMHEIGHNFGFGHSNEGGYTYEDTTGHMGYSFSVDEGTSKCFNAAKSWQSKWYSSKSRIIDPSAGNCYNGRLYGIVDYGNSASSVVLLKIDNSTDTDLYISFNRKFGINSDTGEAENLVTVVSAANEGNGYSDSVLLAKLNVGGTWSGSVDGKNMVVKVVTIDTNIAPAFAQVLITENGSACTALDSPSTAVPTRIPTVPPFLTLPTAHPSSQPPTSIPTSVVSTSPPFSTPPTSSVHLDIPISQHPTTTYQTSSPSAPPTSQTPTAHPTSNIPTLKMPTKRPTKKPTTRRPTWKPTGKPISSQTKLK